MSKTQIVATIGPVSATPAVLRSLHAAGMSIARLNGSHADLDWHARTIATIRETLPMVPILMDIPGRKIRTKLLSVEPVFVTGDRLVLTTDPDYHGVDKIPVNYADLHLDLTAGNIVLADDGTLRFIVVQVDGRDIHLRADCNGQLKSRKGINVPFVTLRTPMVTDRDREMIAFLKKHEVDFVGISFVESAAHIKAIRKLIGGSWPRIVAKVENQGGLNQLGEILDSADAIMIDRGDLSVETRLEQVALFQKQILGEAKARGKPVIVATEMLHSMIQNRFPSKAEVSDITTAVLDGCAATMLSGETAVGAYPVECVVTMRQIADMAMKFVSEQGRPNKEAVVHSQAMGDAIALICRELPISKIVAVTVSGYAARIISMRFPCQPIIAVSNDRMAARSFNLLPGVEGIYCELEFSRTSTDHIMKCIQHVFQTGKLTRDDFILVVAVGYPRSGNRMNLIQAHHVDDLATTLGW